MASDGWERYTCSPQMAATCEHLEIDGVGNGYGLCPGCGAILQTVTDGPYERQRVVTPSRAALVDSLAGPLAQVLAEHFPLPLSRLTVCAAMRQGCQWEEDRDGTHAEHVVAVLRDRLAGGAP